MTDRDPELAEERAVLARIDEIHAMTVGEFLDEIDTFSVKVRDVASDRYLSGYVEHARVTLDLHSVIEQAAKKLEGGE